MSSFTCHKCGADIIDSENGYVTRCSHFPKDDFTEMSGKQMSDGMSQEEADLLAITLMRKEKS